MKGKIKRRKTCFKNVRQPIQGANSHVYPEKEEVTWTRRMNSDEFERVALFRPMENKFATPNVEGRDGNTKLLRPRRVNFEPVDMICDGNASASETFNDDAVVFKPKVLEMINSVNKNHKCDNPEVYVNKEIKKGVCVKWFLQCRECKYQDKFVLYEEVQREGRGCKAARANIGLVAGAGESSVSLNRLSLMINSMGVPSPSHSSLQKNMNNISDKIVKLNEENMKQIREDLVRVNELRGNDSKKINVQTDALYNSQNITRRGLYGRAASTATSLLCEDVTDQHKVIEMEHKTKLCKIGTNLKINGRKNVNCGGKKTNHNCTANHSKDQDFSEEEMARTMASRMKKERKLEMDKVTSDGDSQSSEGIKKVMPDAESLSDPVHKTQSIFRTALTSLDTDLSSDFLNYDCFDVDKRVVKKAFASDITRRINTVFSNLFVTCKNDVEKIYDKLVDCVNAIISCYDGDCSSCSYELSACKKGKRWWYHSEDLKQFGIEKESIKMTKRDKFVIAKIIEMKLSRRAFKTMRLKTNTNKCESVNRTINVYSPKTKRYSRNSRARVAAAIHARNNELANSMVLKLKCLGVSVAKNSRVAFKLKSANSRSKYQTKYRGKKRSGERAVAARRIKKEEYYRKMLKAGKEGKTSDYEKAKDVKVTLRKTRMTLKKTKQILPRKVCILFFDFLVRSDIKQHINNIRRGKA